MKGKDGARRKELCELYKLPRSNVKDWTSSKYMLKLQDKVVMHRRTGKKAKGAKTFYAKELRSRMKLPGSGRIPAFILAEKQVMLKFEHLRHVKAVSCGRRWFVANMKTAVKDLYGDRGEHNAVTKEFKAATGWWVNFCHRWRLSWRSVTNRKGKSLEEKLPVIKRWLAYLK